MLGDLVCASGFACLLAHQLWCFGTKMDMHTRLAYKAPVICACLLLLASLVKFCWHVCEPSCSSRSQNADVVCMPAPAGLARRVLRCGLTYGICGRTCLFRCVLGLACSAAWCSRAPAGIHHTEPMLPPLERRTTTYGTLRRGMIRNKQLLICRDAFIV
eukprot:scaffold208618_cov21-Tisochrysis_lutea.AAC.1